MKTERQLRVSIACLRLPLTSFLMCGRSIVAALTDNEYYADIFPPLPVISEAIGDLAAKTILALSGSRIALAQRNVAWRKAGLLLRQLAASVQARCQNDTMILLRSGFVPTKRRSKIGPLKAPSYLRARLTGNSGEIRLMFQRVHGARGGYVVQLSDSATGPFSTYRVTTSSRLLLSGLEPMKIYWVRVCANGAAGPSGWSVPLRMAVV